MLAALTAAAVFGASAPLVAQNLAGPYLAGRIAADENDFAAAARFYTRALVQDPKNPQLAGSAMIAFVGMGDMDRAASVARRIRSLGVSNQIANMILLAKALETGGPDEAMTLIEGEEFISPLVDGLARAWMQAGQGRMSEALASFDKVSEVPGLQGFGLYHKGLALAMVGDLEGAELIFSGQAGGAITPSKRSVTAHAQILSLLERPEDGVTLIDAAFGQNLPPELEALRSRLVAGQPLEFDVVRNAREGVAEVFFSVALALAGDADDRFTLAYARVAQFLRPDHVDAILLTARVLEELENFDLATKAYDAIPHDHPAYPEAEMGRASALRLSGNEEAAVEVLKQLTKTRPDLAAAHVDLGDLYRRTDRFEESVAAYNRAVEVFERSGSAPWMVYFARGIANERLGDWEKAEADLRKALELSPDQPQVLNYLGYSLVELRKNLDEALAMIERAVEARPDDGYITDSLGWVLYRLGRYDEAVVHMERAAELLPIDPIVNDHLGDVYWAVGRKREAEFQWMRALSFDPEEKDATRIRRKLQVGLDAVLAEEGSAPISVANDG